MTFNNLCNSCANIGCQFQFGIVRTECAFYMPPHIEPDNCGNYVVTQPTYGNGELPNGGWIPVSERLPDRDGQYLVTKAIGKYTCIDCIDYSTNLSKTALDFHGKNYAGWYEHDTDYGYFETHRVIAWMPLPKPFEPQESEEQGNADSN